VSICVKKKVDGEEEFIAGKGRGNSRKMKWPLFRDGKQRFANTYLHCKESGGGGGEGKGEFYQCERRKEMWDKKRDYGCREIGVKGGFEGVGGPPVKRATSRQNVKTAHF